MIGRKISALQNLVNALPLEAEKRRTALPFLQELQESVKETLQETVQEAIQETIQETVQKAAEAEWIEMPFLHNLTPDIRAKWSLADFDPAAPNDVPNFNIAVMALILATNCESTVGKHAWSLVEYSLDRLGFTNIVHQYFEAGDGVRQKHRDCKREICCRRGLSRKFLRRGFYLGRESGAGRLP